MTTPTSSSHPNDGAPAAPPPFSLPLAERLANEAKATVEIRSEPTAESPNAIVIRESRPYDFQGPTIWHRVQPVGHGSNGTVHLEHAILGPRAGQVRAVKILSFDHPGLSEYTIAGSRRRELLASIYLSQPWCERYCVKSDVWFEINGVPNLAMERLAGDLGALQITARGPLAPDQTRVVMTQLLQALEFLHAQQLCHRDIKPENILVQSMPPVQPWVIKLADFGIMEYYADVTAQGQCDACGTPGFVGPDILGHIDNDETSTFRQACKSDVFAAGAVGFILLTGKAPFGLGGQSIILQRYARGQMPTGYPFFYLAETGCGRDCEDLIAWLLRPRPLRRPMASMALLSPWISGVSLAQRAAENA